MKKIFIAFLVMVLLITSCGTENKPKKENMTDSGEVIIPVIFLLHKETGNQANKELVDAFNETYAGQYRIEVEWLVGEESDYRDKIKMLNAMDKLPAIITDVGFMPEFYDLLLENNRLLDVAPYMEEDGKWKQAFLDTVLDICREKDGSLYMVPLNTKEYMSGIFYNKEIFEMAGIETFPQTWDEFWIACEKIQDGGSIPLALHTTGTAWVPMLFCTAYIGTTEEGREFMDQQFPQDYNVPVFREMMEMCKQLFQYTVPEAIGGDFNAAADLFYSGQAAMIPNGQWMIDNFYNESIVSGNFADKIGFAPFPEDIFVGSPEMTAWVVSSGYSEEIQRGAVEFLKFRTFKEAEYGSRKYLESMNQALLIEYYDRINGVDKIVPNYQLKWNFVIQNEVFLEELPDYLTEKITLDKLIQAVNDAVEEYNREINANP